MPKRLSDITHLYQRTLADLEGAQDELTAATERYRARVEAAAAAHRAVADELGDYLSLHPNEVVVANDVGYHWDRTHSQIVSRPVFWSHHIWIEDPKPTARYMVPPLEMTEAAEAKLTAMATAWGDVEPAPADPSPEMMAAFNAGYNQPRFDKANGPAEAALAAACKLGTEVPEEPT